MYLFGHPRATWVFSKLQRLQYFCPENFRWNLKFYESENSSDSSRDNSSHLATPPLVSLQDDVWGTSAETPFWWCVTTQIWIVHLIVGNFIQSAALQFRGETSAGVAKYRLLSHAINFVTWPVGFIFPELWLEEPVKRNAALLWSLQSSGRTTDCWTCEWKGCSGNPQDNASGEPAVRIFVFVYLVHRQPRLAVPHLHGKATPSMSAELWWKDWRTPRIPHCDQCSTKLSSPTCLRWAIFLSACEIWCEYQNERNKKRPPRSAASVVLTFKQSRQKILPITMTETRFYEPARMSTPSKPLFSLKPLDTTAWLRSLLSKVFRQDKDDLCYDARTGNK